MQTLKFFSPLTVNSYPSYDFDGYGADDILEELSPAEAVYYMDQILSAIEKEKLLSEGDRGLAVYLNNELLKNKVYSMNPTVEQWNSELCGVLEVQTYGELTDTELDALKSEWCGQESDGWGEVFEQRPIKIGDNEIYVSF